MTRTPGPDRPRVRPRWRYAAVLLLPAGLAATAATLAAGAPAWHAWLPLLSIHALFPVLDALVGADREPPQPGPAHPLNRWLPVACLPAWTAALLAAAAVAPALPAAAWWGLAASAGAVGGIVAINVAHELIHRNTRLERAAGGLLLATVGYGAFKVEHVRGHHLRVATPLDSASAARGEGLWRFVPRSVVGTLRGAWRLESARLQAARPGPGPAAVFGRLLRHETLGWTLASVAFVAAVGACWGPRAAALVVVAGALAILELEVVNYIEHYGLQRARGPDGRYEPVDHRHSWNVDTAVVNAFLLNLQRHADHHANGGKPYTALAADPRSPQLPAGYGAMVLLALVPPAWRAVMDPRLDRYRAAASAPGAAGA